MLPRSNPVIPGQPEAAQYGVDELNLFPRLTRAAFRAQTGQQAPRWNKARLIKRWYDTSILEGFTGDPVNEVVSYQVFDRTTGKFRRMAFTVADASTPNLPGAQDYPKYLVAPTPAVLIDPSTGGSTPINPAYLCEYSEAVTIAKDLGATAAKVRESSLAFFAVRWNGETRRAWLIDLPSGPHQAASLLAMRHAHGVNAPGRWVTGGEPVWAPDLQTDTGEQDPRPEIPFPVRDLLPGEEIVAGFGGIWVVKRTDLVTSPDALLGEILSVCRQTLAHVQNT